MPFSGSSDKFYQYFWKNFKTANRNNSDLYDILSTSGASWNPYQTLVEPIYYDVSVPEKSWRWKYYIFVDVSWQSGRAYWEDKVNPAKYGFGTWRQNGAGRRITWESGSWDEMPPFRSYEGRTKTGGFEYRTKVTQPLW